MGGVWGWGERSQFHRGGRAQAVDVTVEGLVRAGFGLAAGAAEFGVGAVPGAFEGGDLALCAGEEFGAGESERRAAARDAPGDSLSRVR